MPFPQSFFQHNIELLRCLDNKVIHLSAQSGQRGMLAGPEQRTRHMQVLAEAKAVDDLYAAGKDIKPLCGLAFAVKDNIDVVG